MKKRRKRQEVRVRAGFAGHEREITVAPREGEPTPYGLGANLRVVGTRVPRAGAEAIVTGRAKFTFDVNLPGMLHGKLVRSTQAHARVRGIDPAAAVALPGVLAFVPAGNDAVTYAGQELGAVAAETAEIAREAARLVRVEYEPLPFVVDADEARREGAPRVFGRRPNVTSDADRRGDVEEGFRQAAVTVERTFRTQVQTHAPLETHGVVVRWDGDDALTCWASTQGTFAVREQLAQRFEIPISRVRVLAEFVGGGFGAKLSPGPYGVLAAELARQTRRPVKIMLDRDEEQVAAGNRPSSVQWVRAGADREGRLTAWHVRSYGTAGIARGAEVENPMVYAVANVLHEHEEVHTNAGPGCAMRAPGHPQGAFAVEAIMDELAERLGLDPLEFRRRNDPSEVRRREFEIGAERIGWSRRRERPGSDAGPVKRGIGVAAGKWFIGQDARGSVRVLVHRDGSVEVHNGAQDIGTGTKSVLAVVVAEELGIEPRSVAVRMGDTDLPYGPMSGGSMTATSVAPAARTAAFRVRDRLARLAAAELSVPPERIEAREGRFVDREDASKALPFARACGLMDGDVLEQTAQTGRPYERFTNQIAGVQFAEVEVDTETGVVRPVKIVAVQDCGRVVNRLTAENQVIGGVVMGLSYALYEERVMDRNVGVMVNPDFTSYKIAGPREMPEIEPVLLEMDNLGNAIGMTGLGEPPVIPTAAAIANAVYNATGVRMTELPMTPRRVLSALHR